MSHPRMSPSSSLRSGRTSRPTRAVASVPSGASHTLGSPRLPLIGDRVDVYWEDRGCSFRGTIREATKDSGTRFLIHYDDGDILKQDLDLLRWRYVSSQNDLSSAPVSNSDACVEEISNIGRKKIADSVIYEDPSYFQDWSDVGDLGELLRDHQDSTFNASTRPLTKSEKSPRIKRQRTASKIAHERRSYPYRRQRSLAMHRVEKPLVKATKSEVNLKVDKAGAPLNCGIGNVNGKSRSNKNETLSMHSVHTGTTAPPHISPVSPAHRNVPPTPPPLYLHLQLRAPHTVKIDKKNGRNKGGAFSTAKSPRCLDEFPNFSQRQILSNTLLDDRRIESKLSGSDEGSRFSTGRSFGKHTDVEKNIFQGRVESRTQNINEHDEEVAALTLVSMIGRTHDNQNSNIAVTDNCSGEKISAKFIGVINENGCGCNEDNNAGGAEQNGASPLHREENDGGESKALGKRKCSDARQCSSDGTFDSNSWSKWIECREKVVPLRKRFRRRTE